MLDYDTLTPAVEGCEGIFHLATPVPEDKVVDPEASPCLLDTNAYHQIMQYCIYTD